MKKRIKIKRRDGIRQRYWIGRKPKKNYGSIKTFRKITKGLQVTAYDEPYKSKEKTWYGEDVKGLFKQYPEIFSLAKKYGVKTIDIRPIIPEEDQKRHGLLEPQPSYISGVYRPHESRIEVAVLEPPPSQKNRSQRKIAKTSLHEIGHSKHTQEGLIIDNHEREEYAEDFAQDNLKRLLGEKRTERERTGKYFREIFK